MAEIDIERKPKPNGWPWALALILMLLVVGLTWFLAGPERGGDLPDLMRGDTVSKPEPFPPPPGSGRPGAPETGRPPSTPGGVQP